MTNLEMWHTCCHIFTWVSSLVTLGDYRIKWVEKIFSIHCLAHQASLHTMESTPRHVLSPEERKMAHNVYQFFKWEKENGTAKFGIDQAVKRTADAVKISKSTLHQICKEAKETEEEFGEPVFREKKRKR